MIQRADTTGVFQIESRAQMSMLPRLRPACFYDLVIEVAIVRPGPIQGDMVPTCAGGGQGGGHSRRRRCAACSNARSACRSSSRGDRLAMVAAGHARRGRPATACDGGVEAARRARPYEKKLMEGMQARGYRREFAEQVYRQILGFGDYGFPESHSANCAAGVCLGLAQALPSGGILCGIDQQPADGFLCAGTAGTRCARARCRGIAGGRQPQRLGLHAGVSRRFGKGRRGHGPAHRSRRDHGSTDRQGGEASDGLPLSSPSPDEPPPETPRPPRSSAPSASQASSPSTRQDGPALRLGLCMVRGLSEGAAQRIAAARRAGDYHDAQDLARRARLNRADLRHWPPPMPCRWPAAAPTAWDVAGVEEVAALDGSTASASGSRRRRRRTRRCWPTMRSSA